MFLAHLVNESCSDPGLYVKLKHRQEAFLFDLGDLQRLTPRQLLRVSHVFVSHTHMDHFIGFDYLLRICLGRNGTISLYGPPGFIRNVEGKLAAYTWNLVHNFENDFTLRVTELGEDGTAISRRYRCRRAFEPEEDVPLSGIPIIVDRDDLTVRAVFLDHRVPCLAFALEEKQHINIMKNVLDDMGLAPGQWLRVLKEGIRGELPPETKIAAPDRDGKGKRMVTLEEMARRAVRITPGRKVAYVTDAGFSSGNAGRIEELARGSNVMFIEAAFMDRDRAKAAATFHLTARQAGTLAGRAGVGYIRIFHISPKYKGIEDEVFEEAEEAFLEAKRNVT